MTDPDLTVDPRNHPKGPNFLLIVILFGVAIILIFIGAYFFLLGGGKHLVPGKHAPHPTSRLIFPVFPAANGLLQTADTAAEPSFINQQQNNGTRV